MKKKYIVIFVIKLKYGEQKQGSRKKKKICNPRWKRLLCFIVQVLLNCSDQIATEALFGLQDLCWVWTVGVDCLCEVTNQLSSRTKMIIFFTVKNYWTFHKFNEKLHLQYRTSILYFKIHCICILSSSHIICRDLQPLRLLEKYVYFTIVTYHWKTKVKITFPSPIRVPKINLNVYCFICLFVIRVERKNG